MVARVLRVGPKQKVPCELATRISQCKRISCKKLGNSAFFSSIKKKKIKIKNYYYIVVRYHIIKQSSPEEVPDVKGVLSEESKTI